jgi:anti-sigma regulatory factor (Ser/Thr protein kinase)
MALPSTSREARFERRVDATTGAVAPVRREVVAFAEAHATRDAEGIALAVSEALANVVQHAYRDGSIGSLRVVACAYQRELVVVVRDYGCGMRPHPESPGAGFGLSIMGATASEMKVERPDDGGTRIRLRFAR